MGCQDYLAPFIVAFPISSATGLDFVQKLDKL